MLSRSNKSILHNLEHGYSTDLNGNTYKEYATKLEVGYLKVEILKKCRGSIDGIKILEFEEGQIISLPDSLCKSLITAKYAEEYIENLQEDKAVGPQETKIIQPIETKVLKDYTVKELKEMAKEKGVKGYSKMNEEQLIKAIKE